jgi:hypothetical protein
MTTDNIDRDVEATLARHFVFDLPSDARRSIDRRVQAAISSEGRYRARAADPRRRFALTPRLLAGLGVAAILLAGTAIAGGTLFDRLVGGAPMLENVWERATDISLSVTDAGYTVTLEKAALDQERLWVAVSVTSDQGAADIWKMHVTDASGVVLSGGTGVGTGDVDGTTASLFGFQVPAGVTVSGPFTLEVTLADVAGQEVPGTWLFTFDTPLTPR